MPNMSSFDWGARINVAPLPVITPVASTPTPTPSAAATLTGIKGSEVEGILLGKPQPKFVGGQALIGCRIVEGPFLETVSDVNVVSFIADVATPVDHAGSRTIDYLNLNGTKSWTAADGVIGGGTGEPFEGMVINTKTGSETQTPFASSITRFGDHAVPYRPHALVEVQNCPLAPFNNVVPFASAFLNQEASLSRTTALTRLARDARYDDSEFSFDVSGSDTFWIVDEQGDFLSYLQSLRRIFRTWNVVPSATGLRVFESDLGVIDLTLLRRMIAANSLKFSIADPASVPRQRGFQFVDTGRDNDFNTILAKRERFPEPVTASESNETISLPIGMGASAAEALVYDSLMIDEIARKKMAGTGLYGMIGLECGDVISFTNDRALTFYGIATEVARNHDFSTDFRAEAAIYNLASSEDGEDEGSGEEDFVATFMSQLQY